MSAVLADLTPGFRHPVHGAQQTFRTLLDAMARPGRVLDLPAMALAGIKPPPSLTPGRPMSASTAAVLLCLLDAETHVRLSRSLASKDALAYLRFHTGVRAAWPHEDAAFTVTRANEVDAGLWNHLSLGSDEAPQAGATLIVEVDALGDDGGTALELRGPGVQTTQALRVTGLTPGFWQWRQGLQRQLPRGVDLVLACDHRVAAIPRTTGIALGA